MKYNLINETETTAKDKEMIDFKAKVINKNTKKKGVVYQLAPTITAAIEALQRNNIYKVITITQEF